MAEVASTAVERAGDDQGAIEYLSFTLSGETYAFELARIQSIMMVPTLTEVPRAPRFVLGVCSVRGALVTVLDLRRRMSLSEVPLDRHARILLTQTQAGETLGLLVEAVRHVIRPRITEVESTQAVLGGELPEYILAIARLHHESEQKRSKKRTDLQIRGDRAGAKGPQVRLTRSKKDAEVIVILDLESICTRGKAEAAR